MTESSLSDIPAERGGTPPDSAATVATMPPKRTRARATSRCSPDATYIIQGREDALADYAATVDMVGRMGPNVHLEPLNTTNHVFEETPGQQDAVFRGLAWLTARRA